jgi:hypothetical protein
MRFVELVRRYRWYVLAAVLVYLGLSLFFFGALGDPGDVPFLYLVF